MNDVDLSTLRIEESQRKPITPRRPRGAKLFAAALLALAIVVATTFAWPLLRPVRTVRTAPVRISSGDETGAGTVGDGGTATEAVGWIEADPYPVIVRPLIAGHVESLEVLEGTAVEAGQTVIARLASADLSAARDRAVARLDQARAAATRARSSRVLADERLVQNADARLRLLETQGAAAALRKAVATTRQQLERARATAAGATANVTAQERLAEAGSNYPVALERARADARAAEADAKRAEHEHTGAQRELEAALALVALCEELVADPVDLRGAAAVARAAADQAEADLAGARTELAIAERELGWATVVAPVDGVVLRLEADPGDRVGHTEKGIVALYDPTSLRARIDVPFDSLAGVHEGQRVEIRSDAIGDQVVRGTVQRLQHESDLLKNTLQVKVGLIDPPARLRPETLCRARFLARTPESGRRATAGRVSTFVVPARAVHDGVVHVIDPASGTARAIPIEVVRSAGENRVVRGELSPTQRVVVDPVRAGERVRPGEGVKR